MRIPSGVVDQYMYFVAVDSTDFTTRETGLSSFTVYRSRNGGAAAAMTTPTINETDASNMPGVYELLLDEDMTIDSGDDSQEMVFHITHAGMAPITRVIELYRPKITAGNTLDVTSTGAAGIDWGNVENASTAVDLSGTDIQLADTVTTLTGHTAQTGDTYALANGATGFAAIDTVVDAIKVVTDALTSAAAAKLAASAGEIYACSVDTVTNTHTPTTTEFQSDTITEAPADHFNGRVVIFTSGALKGQATAISDYAAVGGIGQFTVTAMTEAPANNDTFVII